MLNYNIYIYLLVFVIFIILLGLIIYFRFNNKNLSSKLNSFKKKYIKNNAFTIKIENIDTKEQIIKFPFITNFNKSVKKLKNQNLVSDLLKKQDVFYKFWTNCEYDLFSFLEIISFDNKIKIPEEDFLLFYKEFTNETLKIYNEIFIDKIVYALINNYKKYSENDIKFNDINSSTDQWFIDFCEDLKKITSQLKESFNYSKYINSNNNQQSWNSSNYQKRDYNNNYFADEQNKLIEAYKVLNSKPSDDDQTIKKNYRKLAKEYHPDRNKAKNAKEKMAEINNAYDTIMSFREKK